MGDFPALQIVAGRLQRTITVPTKSSGFLLYALIKKILLSRMSKPRAYDAFMQISSILKEPVLSEN
jgi:hypothetical protein